MAGRILRKSPGFCTRINPRRPFYSNVMSLPESQWEAGALGSESSSQSSSDRVGIPSSSSWSSESLRETREGVFRVLNEGYTSPVVLHNGRTGTTLAEPSFNQSIVQEAISKAYLGDTTDVVRAFRIISHHFDTLDLSECRLVLELSRQLSTNPFHSDMANQLLGYVSSRIDYILTHMRPSDEDALVGLLRSLSLMDDRSGLEAIMAKALDLVSVNRLKSEIRLLHDLRHIPKLRPRMRSLLSSWSAGSSSLSAEQICHIIDICVSLGECCETYFSGLLRILGETPQMHMPELYGTISGLLGTSHPAVELKYFKQCVSRILETRKHPNMSYSDHLVLARAMAETGGVVRYRSRAAYQTVQAALQFSSDDPETIVSKLAICDSFSLCGPTPVPTVSLRRSSQELAHRFLKNLKGMKSDSAWTSEVVAAYAQVLAKAPTTKAFLWSDLLERLVRLHEQSACRPQDMLAFHKAAGKAESCPEVTRALISKTLGPLIVMSVRKADSLGSRGLIAASAEEGPVIAAKVRSELVNKAVGLIRIDKTAVELRSVLSLLPFLRSIENLSDESLQVLREYVSSQLLKSSEFVLTERERLAIVETLMLKDTRWHPLIEFAAEDLMVRDLSTEQLYTLGQCLGIPSALELTDLRNRWRTVAFRRLLPHDKEQLALSRSDAEIQNGLSRRLARDDHQRLFPDGPIEDGLSSVKAFCGIFMALTATASWLLDDQRWLM